MMLPVDQTDVEARRPDSAEPFRPANALLHGYLRKLKRMKKKYFILFADTDTLPARLEYFDSEKKWRHGQPPKRSIVIKTCFNINRRYDCKHKLVVALYTKDECFPIAFETEEELTRWFITLLQIQLADRIAEGDELKPIYEHVWQVTVTKKGLGSEKNLVGQHRLCLNASDRVLTLIRMPMADVPDVLEFPVMTIRRCGQINSQFFMEMGRATVTGAGGLWMEADETSTAQYMHTAIIEAMRNSAKDDLAPRTRTRSSSANEQSRPSYHGAAWNAASTSPAANPPPGSTVPATALGMAVLRSRADSVPSRSRSSSETVVEGRPSSVHYVQDPLATSASPPVIPSSVMSTSSMDDVVDGPSHHTPVSSYTRSRLSHTATPENSLPKESTILEEERQDDNTDGYLMMSYPSRPEPSADYLPMTSKPILSSSPSAQSVSSVGRTSSVSSSVRSGFKSQRTTPGPPPIKPPLHPNPYMEMTSPGTASNGGTTWSSPPHGTDGYMPMFPGHSAPGSVGTRSGTHTRSSSFCDDTTPDSYVPMAPLSVASSVTSRDGDGGSYMDMQFRGSVPKDVPPLPHPRGRHSPASSSSLASSVTSGTPPLGSASSRFNEYHLEKVASLLTPSEDDDSVSILRCRQSRAYSVGSRPETRMRRLSPIAQDVASTGTSTAGSGYSVAAQYSLGNQDARVRAYSVGSRGTPGAVQLSNNQHGSASSVQSGPHHEHECQTPHTSPVHCPQAQQVHSEESQRKKSLSVPVLGPGSVPNPTGTFVRAMMAQQTGNRRDDLMEIEFQRTLNGFHLSSDSVDQTDGVSSSSYAAQYGSTDSVGRSSVASTSSSGIGRSRSSVGQVRPGFSSVGRNGKKMEPFRAAIRPRLERLESVPQGRDQDYIEVGDHHTVLNPSLDSPDVVGPKSFGARSAPNGSDKHLDQESGDEYVELAQPVHESRSRDPVPRLSVSELGVSSSATSPGDGDYMAMESNLNKNMAASLTTVLCRIAQEPESSSYMDMSFGQRTRPSSQPGSVSDDFSYLPMDFTPKSSRNPSRQSSQADLDLVIGAVSPSMRGSLTPRSESARHSRTEESFAEHMEMTFDHLPGSASSLRSEKSTRSRMPSPYDGASDPASDLTPTPSAGSKMNRATAFFSHLWGRKSSSVGKVPGAVNQAAPVASDAPRPSRSMPPSPFSSLKRPTKSSKKRRSTTTILQGDQSMSPVSPDADVGQPNFSQPRSHSVRSGSRNSLQSPLTPPSPTVDFTRPQFSPPSPAVVSPKPGSSQPISIGFQRAAAFTPRGSPVIGLHNLNLNLKPAPASDEYVMPVHTAAPNRYSASPSRLVTMPTLSPLPEVNFKAHHLYAPDTPAKSPGAADYVNMDFGGQSKANSNQFRFESAPIPDAAPPPPPPPIVNRTEPSAPMPIPLKSTNEDKENDIVMTIPPIDSKFIDLNSGTAVSTPTALPTKQRANSLEKIVCAILDVSKPGPKRHSSGDKPHKRSSGVSIFRSNSYQPSSSVSRIVVAGNKPASLFPLLTDIPAGKILTMPSSDDARQSRSPSLSTQSSVNNSSRLSVSSTASQGDDIAAGELQGISWSSGERLSSSSSSSAGTATGFISTLNGPSPAATLTSNSSSPSLLVASRPTSVQANEHEVNYAQLDLAPASASHRGSVGVEDASADDAQKSPRVPRPAPATVVFGFTDAPPSSTATTYAQIDFKKTEVTKMTAHS